MKLIDLVGACIKSTVSSFISRMRRLEIGDIKNPELTSIARGERIVPGRNGPGRDGYSTEGSPMAYGGLPQDEPGH
jgi:hypothetical protein